MRRTALVLALTLSASAVGAQTLPAPPPPSSSPWSSAPPPASLRIEIPSPLRQSPGRMGDVETAMLYTTGALAGLGFGAYLAGAAVRSDAGVHSVVLPALGLGAGLATAAMVSRFGEVRRGRVLAVHAGMWLGLGAGAGIAGATDASLTRNEVNLGTHLLFLGPVVGMVAGAGIAAATDARPGSIGFTFSMGLWTGVAGALLESGVRESGDLRSRFPAAGLLLGEGLGIAAGMLLSKVLEPTAAQARWMDAGAAIGALGGLSLGFAWRDSASVPLFTMGFGVISGAALGYFLGAPTPAEREQNRLRDGEANALRAFVSPIPGGALVGLSL